MKLKTIICEILSIEYPIIQGGMTYLGHSGLASAVSNAGGLGVISGNASPEWVIEQINSIRLLTEKPFAVNIIPTSPFTGEIINIILREKIPIVTIGGGIHNINISKLKGMGITVIPVVSTVDSAKNAEKLGADIVVAEGAEAGGHIGRITTMALLPQVVDSLNIPVVAAGGIADGRGLAAALSLGAKGVQMGTRFIASEECIAHPNYKKRIIDSDTGDTRVIEKSTGNPVRCLDNEMARKSLSMEMAGASEDELRRLSEGKFYSGAINGEVDGGLLVAGQSAGITKKIEPVREIIEQMVAEAKSVITNLNALVS